MQRFHLPSPLARIVTGGQTGTDRAALDLALRLGIPCGGWCPKGRGAEDGELDPRYPLNETELEDVAQRTEWNARDSDGTLVITIGESTDGTLLTLQMAVRHKKPLLVLDSSHPPAINTFGHWIREQSIVTLNIAGPRESHRPGRVYHDTTKILETLLGVR